MAKRTSFPVAGALLVALVALSEALVRPSSNESAAAAAAAAAAVKNSSEGLATAGTADPVALFANSSDATAVAANVTTKTDANVTERVGDEVPVKEVESAIEVVRILHLSDTHTLHNSIEASFPLPPADILLFTGDFTNFGTPGEVANFDAWLGTLKSRYPHILLITGNHDWIQTLNDVHSGRLSPQAALDPSFYKSRLSNARVLEHEEVEVLGLRIFGSAWCPWSQHGRPSVPSHGPGAAELWQAWQAAGGKEHRFGEIPAGLDVLLTHGPPFGILDHIAGGQWGSSQELLEALERAKPKVHLFGHVHEQRGHWQHVEVTPTSGNNGGFVGGVEYEVVPGSGVHFATVGSPPADLPVDLISNNAMMNNPAYEGWCPARIAAGARLILATRPRGGEWQIVPAAAGAL